MCVCDADIPSYYAAPQTLSSSSTFHLPLHYPHHHHLPTTHAAAAAAPVDEHQHHCHPSPTFLHASPRPHPLQPPAAPRLAHAVTTRATARPSTPTIASACTWQRPSALVPLSPSSGDYIDPIDGPNTWSAQFHGAARSIVSQPSAGPAKRWCAYLISCVSVWPTTTHRSSIRESPST